MAEQSENVKETKPEAKESNSAATPKMEAQPADEQKKSEIVAEANASVTEAQPASPSGKTTDSPAQDKKSEDKMKEMAVAAKPSFFSDLNYYPQVRSDLPAMRSGDLIRVSYKVIEGGKERIQAFEGTIISLKGTGISRTVTVRKTSFGIAVERIFPLNSRLLQKVEIKKHSRVRRAKLFYLRNLKGKAARLKEMI